MSTETPNLVSTDSALELLMLFLRELGVDEISHSGQSLLSHLTGTYNILQEWNCRQVLCSAGLFHSIYGTEMFGVATRPVDDREPLRKAIGEEAESLVHLYGVIHRQSLYDSPATGGESVLQDFRTGESLRISPEQLSDLFTLDLANTLEQIPRAFIPAYLMEAYRNHASLLPGPALSALEKE